MQVRERLKMQLVAGPEEAPISPEDAVEAARREDWVRVLLALTEDAGLHAAWARAVDPGDADWDEAGRLPWVRAEIEGVDEVVDDLLEEAAALRTESRGGEADEEAWAVLDALARTGIGWAGDPLAELMASLGDAETAEESRLEPTDSDRLALSMVAGAGEPGSLRALVHRSEVVEDVLISLRGAALVGASELWDQFLVWHNRLAGSETGDEADDARKRLEGIGAALDPVLFSRGLIGGDYDMEWASDSEAVADFLQVWGATDWLETVALLEHADEGAAETASVMAMSSARAIGDEAPDEEEASRLIELLELDVGAEADEAQDWEPLATDLGFQFQISVGTTVETEDDDSVGSFGGLLAQIAAHERLVYHGIHSPGVPGLPLSATSMRYLDVESARLAIQELSESVLSNPGNEEEVIRAVRTLCDAATWYRRKPGKFSDLAKEACRLMEPAESDAIQLARGQIIRWFEDKSVDALEEVEPEVVDALVRTSALATGGELDAGAVETLTELADGESVVALDATRRLGLGTDDVSNRRLGELWADGPVARAPFVRQVLFESLTRTAGGM